MTDVVQSIGLSYESAAEPGTGVAVGTHRFHGPRHPDKWLAMTEVGERTRLAHQYVANFREDLSPNEVPWHDIEIEVAREPIAFKELGDERYLAAYAVYQDLVITVEGRGIAPSSVALQQVVDLEPYLGEG
jgi:hypothetical protein